MKPRIYLFIALFVGLASVVGLYWLNYAPGSGNEQVVRYGITPYQDSALPVVADRKGWYTQQGLKVQLVPLSWGDVMSGISSGTIDVAVYNFNSFLPAYQQAALRQPKPVFYAPLFVFKGQAIMVRGDAGFHVLPANSAGTNPTSKIANIVSQLRGKRIAVTKGTELEQIVVAALAKAGMTKNDIDLIYSSPEDALAAFLSGNIDAFAAELTERVEARRHGAVELLTEADVMAPVTDGIITTEAFASKHKDILDKLIVDWFRTINYINANVSQNSGEIRDYLRTSASTRYSPEEYSIAWTFDVFPRSASDANLMFNAPSSRYYWKQSWDNVGDFLIGSKVLTSRPPYSAYMGNQSLAN